MLPEKQAERLIVFIAAFLILIDLMEINIKFIVKIIMILLTPVLLIPLHRKKYSENIPLISILISLIIGGVVYSFLSEGHENPKNIYMLFVLTPANVYHVFVILFTVSVIIKVYKYLEKALLMELSETDENLLRIIAIETNVKNICSHLGISEETNSKIKDLNNEDKI